MKLFLLLFFLAVVLLLRAQNWETQLGRNDHSVVVIAQERFEFDIKQTLGTIPAAGNFDFYFFSSDKDAKGVKDSLNQLLNANRSINKTHLYLLIAGDSNWVERYESINTQLFARKAIINNKVKSYPSNKIIYYNLDSFDMRVVLEDFKAHHQFHFVVQSIENNNQVDVTRDKEKGFGLRSGLNLITSKSIDEDGYLPDFYFDYAINYFKLYKNRWRLNTEVAITFKRPNPQKIIQEQILSQVDVSAIASGSSIDQDINLDIEIIGRFGFQLNTDLYYLLSYQKKFNPYVGVGFGVGSLTSFKGAIDTVLNINIDAGGGFDRSAISGDQDQDLNDADVQQTTIALPTFNLSAGFQHQWGRKISFDMSAKYLLDLKSFRKDNYANRFSIQAGLLYRLSGKRKVIYNYF